MEKFIRICMACGKPYSPTSRAKTSKYCSKECYWSVGRGTLELQCEGCGKTFEVARNDKREAARRFCSHPCFNKHGVQRATFLDYTCEWCGKEYQRQLGQYAQGTTHHFCTSECGFEWRRAGNQARGREAFQYNSIEVPCAHCGKSLQRQPYRLIRSKDHFCDLECRGAWLVGRMAQENHPRWRGGWDGARYYGPGWERDAAKIRKRDGYRCQRCGISQAKLRRKLDVHHIIPFREFGYVRFKNDAYKLANKTSNLISLCPTCHMAVECGTISLQLPLPIGD